MKKSTAIGFLIIAMFLFVSCGAVGNSIITSSETENETLNVAKTLNITDNYIIVRPGNAVLSVIEAAQAIRGAVESSTGFTLKLSDDWYRDESDISKYEILIGSTNRSETAIALASLGEEDWCIAVYGGKIVITGRADVYTVRAVDYFIRTYLTGQNKITLEDGLYYSHKEKVMSISWSDTSEILICTGSWSPRIYILEDGTVIAAYETPSGIKCSRSTDKGLTYDTAHETAASFYPSLSCANPNIFQLDNGDILLSYRATGKIDSGFYTSLQVSISSDGGKSFSKHSNIIEYTENDGSFRGVWEPCLGYLNGVLTCFYANDSRSVTKMQNIEYIQWNGSEWGNRTIICNGEAHNSRDGMPVWLKLSNGTYVCVIESTAMRSSGYPFVIQLFWSADGMSWSEPRTVYIPTNRTSKAGAPGIAELPGGQLVISFQTDEDATVKGDVTSVMKTITSISTDVAKITASDFTPPENVFYTPDGKASIWSGIWFSNGYLYATAGTSSGSSLKRIIVK